MRRIVRPLLLCAFISLGPIVLLGQSSSSPSSAAPTICVSEHSPHGPHSGELLEIGERQFHAEVCIDEKKDEVTVYLLDKRLKSSLAISQQSIQVDMTIKGRPTYFKLKPVPQEFFPAGFSSCYQLTSKELVEGLHAHDADARLTLKVGITQYSVKFSHQHEAPQSQSGQDKQTQLVSER